MPPREPSPESYLKLAPGVSVKALENLYLYDARSDELYEINDEALAFLTACDGATFAKDLHYDDEFLSYCLEEGLIEATDEPSPRAVEAYRAPEPSLRYLELQVTHRCNKRCRHCYIGPARQVDMSPDAVREAMGQFERMGGLRVMISGGEPLMHPQWELINSEMGRFEVRRVLLTNGELLTPELASKMAAHEVQVSIDGMEKGHDAVRGEGSWKKAMEGARVAVEAGLQLSVATMVHRYNLDEFDEMSRLFEALGVAEWGVDVPCAAGNLSGHPDYTAPLEEGASKLSYAVGGSYHGGGEGYACGLHLATLAPDEKLLKCGFYADEPLGNLQEGLKNAWSRARPIPLAELECRGCVYLEECSGGCRFRAPSPLAPDPVMCKWLGVDIDG